MIWYWESAGSVYSGSVLILNTVEKQLSTVPFESNYLIMAVFKEINISIITSLLTAYLEHSPLLDNVFR